MKTQERDYRDEGRQAALSGLPVNIPEDIEGWAVDDWLDGYDAEIRRLNEETCPDYDFDY